MRTRSLRVVIRIVIAAALLTACGRLIADPDRKLLDDAIEGSLGGVRLALAAGGDVHQHLPEGMTVLIWACAHAHRNDNAAEIVDLLIAAGAKVDVREKKNGGTALGWAAGSPNLAVVQRLVKAGADVNRADKNGWTPLMNAANFGDVKIVTYLLEAGASIDVVDSKGRTALVVAQGGGSDVVAVLTEASMRSRLSNSEPASSIPDAVTEVASGRSLFGTEWSDHRLVITGVCSPEHCVSRGRIEWVKGAIPGHSKVVRTVDVTELDSTLLVRAIRFLPMVGEDPARYELDAVNSYTSKGRTLTLTIVGLGAYKATFSGDPLGPPG